MPVPIPVALFVYARPEHLQRTLASLRANQVPLLYIFSDAPRTPAQQAAVAAVRQIVRAIDWCEVVLVERSANLGLGRSVRAGVTAVLERHPALIVFEDDLVCVPGTYNYLSAALQQYQDDERVLSVTGWTHPRVVPPGSGAQPYFDGRAESWVWGTWGRVWPGMQADAMTLLQACRARGVDIDRYGADLPQMAAQEAARNIWAVRWLYLHILHGGLCLRPPHSLVEHIGFDATATNAAGADYWANPPLQPCPPLPQPWPAPVEHPACAARWRRAVDPRRMPLRRAAAKLRRVVSRLTRE